MNLTPVQKRFVQWILNRESARDCKLMGVPYRGDTIIQKHHFCNVDREDDRVTRWVAKHVRPLLGARPLAEAVFQLYLCRVFNEPDVLQEIMPVQQLPQMLDTLRQRKAKGLKILRGAYLVVPHGTSMPVEDFYAAVAAKVRVLKYPTLPKLSDVAAALMSIKGISDFMANQVCADLRYTPGHNRWADWDTFALAGPGTRRGLARWGATGLPPRDTKGRIRQEMRPAAPLLLTVRGQIGHLLPPLIANKLRDLNNLSNCFCEFDKWERARDGEGSLRKYHSA